MCARGLVDLFSLGFIVADIKELLVKFPRCMISYILRNCNGVANRLTKLSLSCSDSIIWFEETLDSIWDVLNQDFCSIWSFNKTIDSS